VKILAVNGSPRKDWNTAILLHKTLEGAISQGAETEFVHLYDLNFKGCQSCFACKKKGGKSYGKCARKDDITPILERVEDYDAIIFGSPVYVGIATSAMRAFMERLLFQYVVYDGVSTLFPKKIKTGFIYTMNMTEAALQSGRWGFDKHASETEQFLKRIFGNSETLMVTDTYQFDDYSKVVAPQFDPEHKAKRRSDIFPIDCQRAFEMGVRFAKDIRNS
jgi:multimeric flavodoxin WrbA